MPVIGFKFYIENEEEVINSTNDVSKYQLVEFDADKIKFDVLQYFLNVTEIKINYHNITSDYDELKKQIQQSKIAELKNISFIVLNNNGQTKYSNQIFDYSISNDSMLIYNYNKKMVIPNNIKYLNFLSQYPISIDFDNEYKYNQADEYKYNEDEEYFWNNIPNSIEHLRIVFADLHTIKKKLLNNIPTTIKILELTFNPTARSIIQKDYKNIRQIIDSNVKVPFETKLIVKFNSWRGY